MGGTGMCLVERDRPIQVLLDAVDAAAGGHSSVVLVTGEAGIGKTSVLRAALSRLDPGVRILRGACDDMLAPAPLQPFRDAVRGSGGALETALLGDEPGAQFEAMMAELGATTPTVLVVEDVHWADDATLDLLRYLGRRLSAVRAVLLLTYRDDEIGPRHPLRPVLGSLAEALVHRIALEPLSVDAVGSVAADAGRDPEELHRLTGGNPFYLTEALACPADAVPATVVDAVLARLHCLDPEAVDVVEQLSVIPRHVDPRQVAVLVGERVDALARAEQRGVLELHADGIGFRHELARRAVEQALPVIRRRSLHATIVGLLLSRQVKAELYAVVHHAVEAGDVDSVVKYAPAAARNASRAGSHRQALAHYEALLPYADHLGPADRAVLLAGYAWELHIAHRFADAVHAGSAALELLEQSEDRVTRAEALLNQSRYCYLAGDTDGATAAVELARTVAADAGSESVLAAAEGCRAMLLVLTGNPTAGVPALERARTLAMIAGRTDLAALCLNYLGLAYCDLDRPGGVDLLRQSIDAAGETGDHEAVARGYTNLAEMLYRQCRWDELEECLRHGLAFADERGFGSHTYNLQLHRALLSMRRGDWPTAAERLRELIDSVDDRGMLSVLSGAGLGRLLARRGDPAAEPLLSGAWDRACRQRSVSGLAYAATAYAEWAWLNDRPDVAEAVRDFLVAGSHRIDGPAFGEFARYLTRAGVHTVGPAHGPAGFRLGVSGDWRAAAAAWATDPYEQALELAESGETGPTLAALETLLALAATPAVTLVRRRLKHLGVRRIPRGVQPRTRANPAGLTDRQLDVLGLLVHGLTNAEIAEKLVVSVRTVDHHVSAILTRLDARTRREAARTARATGLVSAGTGDRLPA